MEAVESRRWWRTPSIVRSDMERRKKTVAGGSEFEGIIGRG
jgi:hypothetical protein